MKATHMRALIRRGVTASLALTLVCALAACGTSPSTSAPSQTSSTSQASTFALRSEVLTDGGTLPAEYTCDGEGATVALSWTGAPAGTREFALLMSTLPGDGTTKWNWVLYGIPSTVSGLTRNTTGIGTLGVGSDGPSAAYQPPCSQGPGAKAYTFTVYALSGSPQVGTTRVTGAVLTTALSSVTLSSASLTVSYTRR